MPPPASELHTLSLHDALPICAAARLPAPPSSAPPQAPIAMLEVDQFFAQVEDALRRQSAALLVLQLARQAVGQSAADGQDQVKCRWRIERPRNDPEQRDTREILLVHPRKIE